MDDLPEKLGEKAIEEIAKRLDDGLRDFAKAIGGEAVVQTGGIIGDQFKYWRFRNTVRILDNTANILRKRGVDPARVLPSHLVPLLKAASLETEDNIREMWTNLLANAADPTRRTGFTASFTAVLQQLSSAEVDILNALEAGRRYRAANPPVESTEWKDLHNRFRAEQHQRVIDRHRLTSLDMSMISTNLERLSVCRSPNTFNVNGTDYPDFHLLMFGLRLLDACAE